MATGGAAVAKAGSVSLPWQPPATRPTASIAIAKRSAFIYRSLEPDLRSDQRFFVRSVILTDHWLDVAVQFVPAASAPGARDLL